jgi:hypothetical protein
MAKAEKNYYDAGIVVGIEMERNRIATWIAALAAKYFLSNRNDLASRYRELSVWIREGQK